MLFAYDHQAYRKSALDRGKELLLVPMRDLPPPALAYARQLCSRLGGCIEVFLTAYAAYAEVVEECPCRDKEYAAGPDAFEFFGQPFRRRGERWDS